jgi:glycosyltransferase involved in cell wall biosynthesis
MKNFTIVIPYHDGEATIGKLLKSIPDGINIVLVDDHSKKPISKLDRAEIIRDSKRGYFTGAVNFGIRYVLDKYGTDVLILNQDIYFTNTAWINQLEDALNAGYSYIGERIRGDRPDWPNAYIHGTFMYLTKELIDRVGLMNESLYPMWGSTAEYQLRAARARFNVLPIRDIKGFVHIRPEGESFGNSFKTLIKENPKEKKAYTLTPPLVSVVIPVHGEKYAKFLPSTINSLVGGMTDLGVFPQQTFASFEVVIVDDSSEDDTPKIIESVCDGWKGVRSIRLNRGNVTEEGKYTGKTEALNAGIQSSYGRYISILDADDMMEPDRLEKMTQAMMANPHSIIYDDCTLFSDGQRTTGWLMQDYDFERLIRKNQIHNAIMFEKSAWKEIGGYPSRFKFGREDWAINVKFGIFGYCGVHVKHRGLLYRRETQNRTLENTKPEWMTYFAKQMVAEYPEIYRGGRPMGCCGRGARATSALRTQAFATKGVVNESVLKSGTELLEYTGTRKGAFSVWGFKTGAQYRVTPGKLLVADKLDLYSDNPKKYPGLMDRYNPDNSFMFNIHTPVEKVAEVKLEDVEVEIKLEEELEVKEEISLEEIVDYGILDTNVTALKAKLSEGVWSIKTVTALLAYELNNKKRLSAIELLEAKINELRN